MTDSKSISNRQPAGHGLGPDIHRKVRYWGAGGLLLFIALAGGLDFERLRNDIFDLYQRWSPRQVETLPARLVEIDEASLREIGAWPWPRRTWARACARGTPALVGNGLPVSILRSIMWSNTP